MRHLIEVAATGVAAVRLHPLPNLVSAAALLVVLLPYLAGLALAQGLEADAEASAQFGADLYVAGTRFGRPAPLPLAAADAVRALDGVTEVVPRIVGEVVLGKEAVRAVLVGIPPEHFPAWADCVEGRLPRDGGPNQLVLGAPLARRLGLRLGDTLPPFYHSERERLSRVVGIFRPDAPPWQAHLVLTTLRTAAHVFNQPDRVTGLLVWCRPGYQGPVTRQVVNGLSFPPGGTPGSVRARVTSREELRALLPRGALLRGGVFTLHFVLAFVAGILVLLVTSGLGLAERRREIGILKATGWQTDEVLLRGAVEGLCLALAAACAALLLAWVWLRAFNGYGIAAFFLDGAGAAPDFAVPYRLAPAPALLAFVLALAVVLTGTLWSSWRAATAAPREAMR